MKKTKKLFSAVAVLLITAGCGRLFTAEVAQAKEMYGRDYTVCSYLRSESGLSFNALDIPEYTGSPYVDINDDVPFFSDADITGEPYELYGDFDALGRCTCAEACVGPETMPEGKRGPIGMVKPTGWHTVKYDGIDGNYLYNRCHLIGYQLTGENANEENLITGTRYLNVEGMLPFENSVAEYVRGTGHHVMYRVTPVFKDSDLLCRGVLMEARSVEDPLVQFCVFCYNVQPGIEIDYATGDSRQETAEETQEAAEEDFVVNTNTGKFHIPSCSSVEKMKEKNKKEVTCTRDELIEKGYSPCGMCHP